LGDPSQGLLCHCFYLRSGGKNAFRKTQGVLRIKMKDLKIGGKILKCGRSMLQETTTTLKGGKKAFENYFQNFLNSLVVDIKHISFDGRL
jgi:hypothetical protein